MSIDEKIKLAEYLIETMVEVRANLDIFCPDQTMPKRGTDEWVLARYGLSAQTHLSDLISDLEMIYDSLLDMKEDSDA